MPEPKQVGEERVTKTRPDFDDKSHRRWRKYSQSLEAALSKAQEERVCDEYERGYQLGLKAGRMALPTSPPTGDLERLRKELSLEGKKRKIAEGEWRLHYTDAQALYTALERHKEWVRCGIPDTAKYEAAALLTRLQSKYGGSSDG